MKKYNDILYWYLNTEILGKWIIYDQSEITNVIHDSDMTQLLDFTQKLKQLIYIFFGHDRKHFRKQTSEGVISFLNCSVICFIENLGSVWHLFRQQYVLQISTQQLSLLFKPLSNESIRERTCWFVVKLLNKHMFNMFAYIKRLSEWSVYIDDFRFTNRKNGCVVCALRRVGKSTILIGKSAMLLY